MNLDKVKDAARKFEQKEDWRRAIEVYQKAIQEFESGADPTPDVAIYNKVGDLHIKAGDSAAAVQVFERAVDLYTEQGFYNNGIALCGKILRVNPGRVQVYLKLAQLHARKDVVIDAKKNLLEYLERMAQAKKLDEAFQALKKFAEQFWDHQDIREMLAELLRAAARSEAGHEDLAKLADELVDPSASSARRGSTATARPSRASVAMPKSKGDLVFLDIGDDEEPAPEPPPPPPAPKKAAAPAPPPKPAPEPEPIASLDLEPTSVETPAAPPADAALGLEPTSLEADLPAPTDAAADLDGLVLDSDAGSDAPAVSGLESAEFTPPGATGDLDLSLDAAEAAPAADAPVELTLDTDVPVIGTPAVESTFDADTPVLRASGELLAVDLPEEPAAPLVERNSFEPDADAIPAVADEGDGAEPPAGDGAGLVLITADEPRQPTVEELEERILDDPDNPELHRSLGEVLVAGGDLHRGTEELELALLGYEGREDWNHSLDLVSELIRVDPAEVRFYQKRVELSFRLGDRERLIAAYLELGDALMRSGALDKAVAVYRRVAEHDPTNARAAAALQTLAPPEEPAPPPPPKAAPATSGGRKAAPPAEPPAPRPAAPRASQPVPVAEDGFVDLGALVQEEDAPKDTRMRIGDEEPTGDEQKDFQEMLSQFKAGIEKSVDVEDFQTHYDLGVAFKEMGLLDEAIAEFQKALRAPEGRLRTSEALGNAFYEKGQFAVAEAILRRAVDGIPGGDDQKLGLLYWLGRSTEAQQKAAEARSFYERALAVDIRFQDAADRVRQLGGGVKK